MKALTLVLVLFSFSSHAAQYLDAQQGIQFDYNEANWEVVPAGSPDRPLEAVDKTMAERTLVTVQRKIPDDKYRARFSVVLDPAEKFKGNESERLLAYQKHAVKFLEGQRFHIMDSRTVSLPNVKTLAFEVMANQRDFGLLFRQVAILQGDSAYLITAAARTAKFPVYKDEIAKMFDSFKLLPPVKKAAAPANKKGK